MTKKIQLLTDVSELEKEEQKKKERSRDRKGKREKKLGKRLLRILSQGNMRML